jgi:hypothetical protein
MFSKLFNQFIHINSGKKEVDSGVFFDILKEFFTQSFNLHHASKSIKKYSFFHNRPFSAPLVSSSSSLKRSQSLKVNSLDAHFSSLRFSA